MRFLTQRAFLLFAASNRQSLLYSIALPLYHSFHAPLNASKCCYMNLVQFAIVNLVPPEVSSAITLRDSEILKAANIPMLRLPNNAATVSGLLSRLATLDD
jgi:hypothetical protein